MNNKKGFTLVELLIVIAVIAILAAVAFVAIDPATRFAEARNAQRWTDVSAISEAIQQYAVDNEGSLPGSLSAPTSGTNYYFLGTGSGTPPTCTAQTSANTYLNLSSDLVSSYLPSMPYDPKGSLSPSPSTTDTYYYLGIDSDGNITIGACEAELSESISVTR